MPLKQSILNFENEEHASASHIAVEEQEPTQQQVIEIESPFSAPVNTNAVGKAGRSPQKSTRGRMKLSEMDACIHLVEVPEDKVLFEKRYYSIGTVSEMFKVNPSLIRFWENEFDILKPKKNGKGDRFFRPEDVKSLQLIYLLLREKKYTIEGAKEFLKKNKKADEKFVLIESLKKLKGFLSELKTNL